MKCPNCIRKPGKEYDFQFGYSVCRTCKGLARLEDPYEDRVLLAVWGPIWLTRDDKGELTGVEISHSGPLSVYGPYESAAEHLVADGLLTPGNVVGRPSKAYSFTKRGFLARWGITEEVARAIEKH